MKYFEILPDTKEFESADRVFSWKEPWQTDEVINAFKDALGIEVEGNLRISSGDLVMNHIPEGKRDQFRKKRTKEGYYRAKVKSEMNQKYLAVVKKYNLTTYSIFEFSFQFGFDVIKSLNPITNPDKSHRFFIKLRDNLSEKYIKKISINPSLKEIPEYEYLRIAEMSKDVDA